MARGQVQCRLFDKVERMDRQDGHFALGAAALDPVHARGRQAQRLQVSVDLLDRPSGDQRQRAAQVVVQRFQRADQPLRHDHSVRLRRQVHQRAIEIEKQGAGGGKHVREIHGLRR